MSKSCFVLCDIDKFEKGEHYSQNSDWTEKKLQLDFFEWSQCDSEEFH